MKIGDHNKTEKISIIVPMYNMENYIKECLDSLLNQDYKNTEIILVDDGSTDSTRQICEEYRLIDKRVFIINKNNEGVSIARNTGLENSTGEWVVFVDPDDYCPLNMCSKLLEVAKQTDSEIVFGRHEVIGKSCKVSKDNGKITIYEGKEINTIQLSLFSHFWDRIMCIDNNRSHVFKLLRMSF